MRYIAFVVMVGAACADSHYGTYLVVEGDGKIAFDRVEFYFGDFEPGEDVPTSPLDPAPVMGMQYLNTRIFDPLDNFVSNQSLSSFTYYIPASGGNDELVRSNPSYVMIVAYNAGKSVGITEQVGFALDDTMVNKYIVHLEPFEKTAVEMWGHGTPDCIKWRRLRDGDPSGVPSTVAVVRADDRDCDGYLDSEDCNRYIYCGPDNTGTMAGCVGHDPCITGTDRCVLGACTQVGDPGSGTAPECAPTTCLFDGACSASCDPNQPVVDRFQCAFSQTSHTEVFIPLDPMEQLCMVPYKFDIQIQNGSCGAPQVEYPFGGREPDGFVIKVSTSTGDPMACTIAVFPPVFGDPTFHDNDDHVVLSVLSSSPTLTRTTFVFGLHPGGHGPGACLQPPVINYMGSGAASCL